MTASISRPLARPRERPAAALAVACAALGLGLGSCGGGSELLVIPLFGFGFGGNVAVGAASVPLTIFLNPAAPTTPAGDPVSPTGGFDSVNLTLDPAGANPLNYSFVGSYDNCRFSLAFKTDGVPAPAPPTAPIDSRYSGRFTSTNAIELKPDNAQLPTLKLQRLGDIATPLACS